MFSTDKKKPKETPAPKRGSERNEQERTVYNKKRFCPRANKNFFQGEDGRGRKEKEILRNKTKRWIFQTNLTIIHAS